MYWVGKKVISFFFMIFKANLLIQITNINQLCIDHFVRWPFAIFQSASWFRYRRKFASWRQKTESTHFWQPHLNRMFFHSNGFEVNGINDERMMQDHFPGLTPIIFCEWPKMYYMCWWKMMPLRVASSGRFSFISFSNFISWRQ